MIKVKLKKSVYKSGENITLAPGHEYEFDKETAEWLVDNDFGEIVKSKPRKTKEKKVNLKTK